MTNTYEIYRKPNWKEVFNINIKYSKIFILPKKIFRL